MTSSHSSDEFLTCSDSSDSESISESSSNEEVQETEIHSYDDSVEPVPTEEEAAQYIEQLELEEEEELTLLSRFSGEEDVSDWCKCSNCSLELITKPEECWCCTDIDRCHERMYEVEKEGQCITEHPGYAACCLNSWVLSTAAIGLKTKAKKSYATTKTDKNAAEPEFMRSVAYRQYVRLVYEYIGASHRIPLPNCVYNSIRKAFPNTDGQYTGYEEEVEED
ncbi:P2X purinoceptor 7-like [Oculina patagonica]